MRPAFTIGVDFGTNSVRAVVVDCADGRMIGTRVFNYPSGDQGVLLDARDPHLARQRRAGAAATCTRSSSSRPAHAGFARAA